MDKLFEVHTDYTPALFLQGCKLRFIHTKQAKIWQIFLCIYIIFTSAVLFLSVLIKDYAFALFSGIFLLLALFLFRAAPEYRGKRILRKGGFRYASGTSKAYFYKEHIQIVSAQYELKAEYSQIENIYQDKNYFYVDFGSEIDILDKRGFQSGAVENFLGTALGIALRQKSLQS